MAASKVNREDAQEWLESLQQVGEGWYRQVALAVRAGAHKALGMERREFAQHIGQRMIDPREAVIELYREQHTIKAIEDVLGLSNVTVRRILMEAGLIEVAQLPPAGGWGAREKEARGEQSAREKEARGEHDGDQVIALQEQLADAEAALSGQKKKAAEAAKEYRKEAADLKKKIVLLERATKEAESKEDKKAAERHRKEAEAELQELERKMLSKFAGSIADGICASMENATEQLGLLIRDDVLTTKAVERIGNALQALNDQYRLAELAAREE
jgi:hypothetical protein